MADANVESTDDQLVGLVRSGDHGAFVHLFHRHNGDVFNLAYRLTEDRELAGDVAQEAWIRAWRGMEGFRGEAAFSTWIYRITANTASTWRRRRTRHSYVELDDTVEPAVVDSRQIPETDAENAELRDRLRRALGSLSPALRTVVVMKDVYGWSHEEIADSLGISVTAAKVRLHRAHQKLQVRLHGEPR